MAIKVKKKIYTSKWVKPEYEPIIISKVINKKVKVPFILNSNFIEDKLRLIELFDIYKKTRPKYFINLTNELKNKNRVNEIFSYAKKYLKGVYNIKDIEAKQKRPFKSIITSIQARVVAIK